MQPVAGYWTLRQRTEAEMQAMSGNWASYLEAFRPHAPELLSRPEIVKLAGRLEAMAVWVAEQLAVGPSHPCATLVHGDYKAMNVFLPLDLNGEAVPIDFQWIGVGLGMSDVSMHLSHSVSSGALHGDGEKRLLDYYVARLAEASGKPYDEKLAWRHYCMGVVDWARMVFSVFFKAASPESFAQKAENPNVGLVYRDMAASFAFVERVDRSLRYLENYRESQRDRSRSRSPR